MSVAEKLKAIADKFRSYKADKSPLTLDDMANEVDGVYSVGYAEGYDFGEELGYDHGFDIGYTYGKTDGMDEGIEQGKKDAYDEFWDIFQDNGNRTDYYRAFGGIGWDDNTYQPKYDIAPQVTWDCSGLFLKSKITDIYKNDTINIDFSKCGTFTQPFSESSITHIKILDTRSAKACTQILQTARNLVTIEKLILKDDGSQVFNLAFNLCGNLANLTIEGTIGQSIDLQWSPLTEASIRSVIGALSRTATGQTLTLKKSAKEAAFTESAWAELIAPVSNQYNGTWTISLL